MSRRRRLLQSAPFQPIFTHRGQAKTRKKTEKLFTEIRGPDASDTRDFHVAFFRLSFRERETRKIIAAPDFRRTSGGGADPSIPRLTQAFVSDRSGVRNSLRLCASLVKFRNTPGGPPTNAPSRQQR
jgi:hypothetical protein